MPGMKRIGGKLLANFSGVTPEFAAAVKNGRYKKVSMLSIYLSMNKLADRIPEIYQLESDDFNSLIVSSCSSFCHDRRSSRSRSVQLLMTIIPQNPIAQLAS